MRPLIFIFVVVTGQASAQTPTSVSVSGLVRYGSGTETTGPVSEKRDYFESLTDTRIQMSDVAIGFRLLFDSPPEYGVEYAGLSRRFVEFAKEDLWLRAGTSFTLFGRGLSLNQFDNRALAFDNSLDGIKGSYHFWKFDLAATAGDITYRDVLDFNRVEHYRIRAASILFAPIPEATLGFSFVTGELRFEPPAFPDVTADFDVPEYSAALRLGDLDVYLAYCLKRTRTGSGIFAPHLGTGAYGSLGYSGEGFGVSLEYKDYRFGMADPHQRGNAQRSDRAYAFQFPPVGHREHTFVLMSRYPHIIDFNDEVGMQCDVFVLFGDRLSGTFNGAMASRHYRWVPTGDSTAFGLPVYGRAHRSGAFLPDLSPAFSPFYELYAELQYYLNEEGSSYVLAALNRRSSIQTDEANFDPVTGPALSETRLWDVPVVFQYTFEGGLSVRCVAERQWVNESASAGSPRYTSQLFSLSVTHPPSLSAAVRLETTSRSVTEDGRTTWVAADLGMRVGSSHSIAVTVGAERGGTVCSNGVCRTVKPFRGVRASLVSYF